MQGERFWRAIALAALLLCGVLVGERYLRVYMFAAAEPRVVVPRPVLGGEEQRISQVFRTAAPSVVSVYARRGGRRQQGAPASEQAEGSGSGFIWDRAGHIVTNNHVIENATEVGVVLDDGRALPARVVGQAPWADLAVLRLTSAPADLVPIPVGRSSDLEVGQSVLAIGNPFGLSRTLTSGIISALDRQLPTPTGRVVTGVIQTDAAINPGNSGGQLVNRSGRLIGVNTAIIAPSGTFAGIGFAIPVDTVNRIVPALIRDGRAPLPGIGIVAVPAELALRSGLRGVVIQDVLPRGSAARAGIEGVDAQGRVGDIIVAANGKLITNIAELSVVLEEAGIGNAVRLTVVRGSQRREISVQVQDINTG